MLIKSVFVHKVDEMVNKNCHDCSTQSKNGGILTANIQKLPEVLIVHLERYFNLKYSFYILKLFLGLVMK